MKPQYRDLTLEDADDLADILAVTWHGYAEGQLQHLHGLIDFARYAQCATYTRVAEMDGKAVGVVMARAGQPSKPDVQTWKVIEDKAWQDAQTLDAESTQWLADYFSALEAMDAQLLEESGCDPNYELVLFGVAPETRGHGVGSTLLPAAQDYLRNKGAESAFLYTDTDCTWEYYERRGMNRAAERMLSEEERGPLSQGMFLYEMKL